MANHQASFNASKHALSVLMKAVGNFSDSPVTHIHFSSNSAESHSRLKKLFSPETIDKLEAKFHLGNYVIDRQTGEKNFEEMSIYVRLGMHFLYYGKAEEYALHWKETEKLLKEESEKMGKEYDNPKSKAHIWPFIKSFNLQDTLSEMVEPDPDTYPTFNAFFAREIKESARPIAEPHNDNVTSSCADCRTTVFPTVDLATEIWIKGKNFTLERLLGSAELAQKFDGGSICIARLAPQDYHRWHSPISGTVRSITDIPGQYYTVNPQAINEPGVVNVFCENKRSVMTIQRHSTFSTGATIALVAVGAMLVGSIKYVVDEIGAKVKRGQCLGAFYYGGSTVIVLYPPGEVKFDEDLVKNSCEEKSETLVKVGWRIGIQKGGW